MIYRILQIMRNLADVLVWAHGEARKSRGGDCRAEGALEWLRFYLVFARNTGIRRATVSALIGSFRSGPGKGQGLESQESGLFPRIGAYWIYSP